MNVRPRRCLGVAVANLLLSACSVAEPEPDGPTTSSTADTWAGSVSTPTEPPVWSDAQRDAVTRWFDGSRSRDHWARMAVVAEGSPSSFWAVAAPPQVEVSRDLAERARREADGLVGPDRGAALLHELALQHLDALDGHHRAELDALRCLTAPSGPGCATADLRAQDAREVLSGSQGALVAEAAAWDLVLDFPDPVPRPDPLAAPPACTCDGPALIEPPGLSRAYVGEPVALSPVYAARCSAGCTAEVKGSWLLTFTPDGPGAVLQIPLPGPRVVHTFDAPGAVTAQFTGSLCCGTETCGDAPRIATAAFRVDEPSAKPPPPPTLDPASLLADLRALRQVEVDGVPPADVRRAWRDHLGQDATARVTQRVPLPRDCARIWAVTAIGTAGHIGGVTFDLDEPLEDPGDTSSDEGHGVDRVPERFDFALSEDDEGNRSLDVSSEYSNRWLFRIECYREDGSTRLVQTRCPGSVDAGGAAVAESDCRSRHDGPVKLGFCGIDLRRFGGDDDDAIQGFEALLDEVALQLGAKTRLRVDGTTRPKEHGGAGFLFGIVDFDDIDLCPEVLDARLQVIADALGATYERDGSFATIRGPDAGGDCPGYFLTLPRP